jgi:hypothetical protein
MTRIRFTRPRFACHDHATRRRAWLSGLRRMMRYARYAAAIVFALLAVGFVALWVRSYRVRDRVEASGFGRWQIEVQSEWGVVAFTVLPDDDPGWYYVWGQSAPDYYPPYIESTLGFGFDWYDDVAGWIVSTGHWFLAASSLGLASLFAFKRNWRYSLRSILVGTTVLAALLGLAMWAV